MVVGCPAAIACTARVYSSLVTWLPSETAAERMSALILEEGKRQEVANIADQVGHAASARTTLRCRLPGDWQRALTQLCSEPAAQPVRSL